MNTKRLIIGIDLVLVLGSLFVIAGLVGYARPLVIAPTNDLVTTNNFVLFSFDKGDKILIDDNLDFSSPEEFSVKDNFVIRLKPGVYYWKVEGLLGSEIRKFTIESDVDLKLKESGQEGVYNIVNAGNTKLNVGIYQGDKLKENVTLGIYDDKNVSGTKFIGGQADE